MPHDFPMAFGPCKTEKGGVEEPQTALIIEEVVNMALGQGGLQAPAQQGDVGKLGGFNSGERRAAHDDVGRLWVSL
jgi:hypothetical protein